MPGASQAKKRPTLTKNFPVWSQRGAKRNGSMGTNGRTLPAEARTEPCPPHTQLQPEKQEVSLRKKLLNGRSPTAAKAPNQPRSAKNKGREEEMSQRTGSSPRSKMAPVTSQLRHGAPVFVPRLRAAAVPELQDTASPMRGEDTMLKQDRHRELEEVPALEVGVPRLWAAAEPLTQDIVAPREEAAQRQQDNPGHHSYAGKKAGVCCGTLPSAGDCGGKGKMTALTSHETLQGDGTIQESRRKYVDGSKLITQTDSQQMNKLKAHSLPTMKGTIDESRATQTIHEVVSASPLQQRYSIQQPHTLKERCATPKSPSRSLKIAGNIQGDITYRGTPDMSHYKDCGQSSVSSVTGDIQGDETCRDMSHYSSESEQSSDTPVGDLIKQLKLQQTELAEDIRLTCERGLREMIAGLTPHFTSYINSSYKNSTISRAQKEQEVVKCDSDISSDFSEGLKYFHSEELIKMTDYSDSEDSDFHNSIDSNATSTQSSLSGYPMESETHVHTKQSQKNQDERPVILSPTTSIDGITASDDHPSESFMIDICRALLTSTNILKGGYNHIGYEPKIPVSPQPNTERASESFIKQLFKDFAHFIVGDSHFCPIRDSGTPPQEQKRMEPRVKNYRTSLPAKTDTPHAFLDSLEEIQKDITFFRDYLANYEDLRRKDNIKIRGIPESIQPTQLNEYISKMISHLLPKREGENLIEKVFRIQRPTSLPSHLACDVIVSFFPTGVKNDLLGLTRNSKALPAPYSNLSFFKDLSKITLQRRKSFLQTTRSLTHAGIRYLWTKSSNLYVKLASKAYTLSSPEEGISLLKRVGLSFSTTPHDAAFLATPDTYPT